MFAPVRFLPLVVVLLAVTALSGCFTSRSAGSSSGLATLEVYNRDASVAIWYVYISSCASSSWGDDQLDDEVIMPGARQSFVLAPGCYDLKVKYRDDVEVVQRNRTIGGGTSWTWTVTHG